MLIDYLPPIVKKIKEMQAITSAEQPQFDDAEKSIDQILANMFILLADENGISRFEQELGIEPGTEESLEDRRLTVLSKSNKSKVTAQLIINIVSNYSTNTELIKDYDNDELKIALNTDANSLETIYKILDEKLPLNIYFDFLLQRKYNVGIAISSKIYEMYDHAAGEGEYCGRENQITSIAETVHAVSVGGFCNINPIIAAGQTQCGADYGEITTSPVYTTEGVNVELSQEYSASNTPVAYSGEKYAGEEG